MSKYVWIFVLLQKKECSQNWLIDFTFDFFNIAHIITTYNPFGKKIIIYVNQISKIKISKKWKVHKILAVFQYEHSTKKSVETTNLHICLFSKWRKQKQNNNSKKNLEEKAKTWMARQLWHVVYQRVV